MRRFGLHRFALAVFSFLILHPCCLAQKLFFEQLTTAEGLPSDYVNCVFRDSKGFLWIGTDKGVCRYDGQHFLSFNKDNGLTSNFVSAISEDPQGTIWLGTFEGGICKYNGHSIEPYPLNDTAEFKNIFNIECARNGSLFILSGQLHLFYLRKGRANPQMISDSCYYISSLQKDSYLFSRINRLINLIEMKDNKFSIRKLWQLKTSDIGLMGNSSQNHFLTVEGDSLVYYSIRGDKALADKKIFLRAPIPNDIRRSFITNETELWLALPNGVLYNNGRDKPRFLSSENGLGTNYVNNIYEDGEGNVYLCTFGGGIRIWPRLYLEECKVNGKVNSILADHNTVYITTTNGVYRYAPGGKCTELKNLHFDNFISSYHAPDGNFYLGTYHGFLTLPGEQGLYTITSSSKKKYESFEVSGVSGFLFQQPDKLLVSTYGDGIGVFDHNNRSREWMNPGNKRTGSVLVEFLKPLKNSFAALSFNSGVSFSFNDGHTLIVSKKDGLLSNSVYSVFQDKEKEIWIGTLEGLNLFDGNRVVKTFSRKEGFTGSRVICIFRDSVKRLWVLSDQYLHLLEGNRLRPIRSHPLLYTKNSINRAEYDSEKHLLYLGMTDAFLVVDVNRIFPDTTVQPPVITSMTSADSSLLNEKINLRSADKIVFRFGNLHYSLTKQSDIYYRLKGYDEDWKLLDHSSEVVYQKLSPGNYELVAKTVNPDHYSSKEISMVRFEVLPPFWKQPWFVLLSSVLLLGTIFFTGSRYSKKRYERRIHQMREQHKLQLERERIARELHDNVGSQLTYLINKIEDEEAVLKNKEEAVKLGSFAREAMRELRETIWALDKKQILPEELGNKVRQLLRLYNGNGHTIELEWKYNSKEQPLNSLEALNIYRIIQEAVNNAAKYSEASEIRVRGIFSGNAISVSISDNGKGFQPNQSDKGYGLQNMQKRADEMNGNLQIRSAIDKGTSIDLELK
jgi:signal transduction histidine kinase/ligand-binding sensor domain-containing protein